MIDTQPRELTDDQKRQLEIFANETMEKLELHRTKLRLEASNREKEVLLKEIHHRVKNNFQVTMSLINMQKRGITDQETIKKFDKIKNRIGSMAEVHNLLYKTEDLSSIDPSQYFQSIIKANREIQDLSDRDIEYDISVEVESMDFVQAIPCGLIVND